MHSIINSNKISPIYSSSSYIPISDKERLDNTTAQVYGNFVKGLCTTINKITPVYKYPKMSLYKFHQGDTWLNTAGRVALWAGSFFSGGLLVLALGVSDLYQNFREHPNKKEHLHRILDQLNLDTQSKINKLSYMYDHILHEHLDWDDTREIAKYNRDTGREVWTTEVMTKETRSQHLENLKHMPYSKMVEEGYSFIQDQLQDVANRCKDRIDTLAHKLGINKEMEPQEQEAIIYRKGQAKDAMLKTTASRLVETLKYVYETHKKIDDLAIQKGREQIEKVSAQEGKTLQELGYEDEEELKKISLTIGYIYCHLKIHGRETDLEDILQRSTREQLLLAQA